MPKHVFKVDGVRVPGVTTITGMLDKPALVKWAYNLGKEGKDMDAVRTESLNVGKYVHALIQAFLVGKGEELNIPEEHKEIAVASYTEFQKWFVDHIEASGDGIARLSEYSLVHNVKGYGGVIDALMPIAGEAVLIDFKTSSMIPKEAWLQVAAYAELLKHNGIDVHKVAILRLPKNGDPYEYVVHDVSSSFVANSFAVFDALLVAYKHLNYMGRL